MTTQGDRAEELDLAATYYSSARQEIIARIAQRDQALTVYLAAAGVIGGAVVADLDARCPVLFVLPVLAAGAAFVLAQHNDVIGALGRFLASELGGWVRGVLPDAPPHWDGSVTLTELKRRPFVSRRVGQLLLIPGPAAAALVAAVVAGVEEEANAPALAAAAVCGAVAVMLSALAVERSYKGRVRQRFGGPTGGAEVSPDGEDRRDSPS